MRRAQTAVEYMLVISVLVVAIYFVLYVTLAPLPAQVSNLGTSLATSLSNDGIQ